MHVKSLLKMQLLLWLLLLYIAKIGADLKFSNGGARTRFETKFNQTCGKYTFVSKFMDMLEHPRPNYMLFVFHEAGQASNGGLGDRLAGMIHALAYAIRTDRTFLIQGDSAFEDAFQPYYNKHPHNYSWRSWDWANWRREHSANMTKLHCVNPRPSNRFCALDDVNRFKQFKVIKFFGNRSYLCRWLVKKKLGLSEDILQHLQIEHGSDLYEVAGCLLRLAIWPTEKLWSALDESLAPQLEHRGSAETTTQIGFHFRCGDSSFSSTTADGKATPPNPECYFDEPKTPWKGTNFLDDTSIDSPVDEAACGKQLLVAADSAASAASQSTRALAYIASDNADSSSQINSTLGWPFTIKPPQGCHVDLQSSAHCTLTTSLHWFMLAQSDRLVMQALIKPAVSMFDNSPETAHLAQYEQPAPISAFSRYAAIYSLSKDAIRYGRGCAAVNQTALSQQTHGNWVCDPKTFY